MDKLHIRTWTQVLARSLGEPRPPANEQELRELHEKGDYEGMLAPIKNRMSIALRVGLEIVHSSREPAPAWMMMPRPLRIFGRMIWCPSKASVCVRSQFLTRMPFHTVVMTMAHEMAHVLLHSTGHELRHNEQATDLTVLLMGYGRFYTKGANIPATVGIAAYQYFGPAAMYMMGAQRLGYLSEEEALYALQLMRR